MITIILNMFTQQHLLLSSRWCNILSVNGEYVPYCAKWPFTPDVAISATWDTLYTPLHIAIKWFIDVNLHGL